MVVLELIKERITRLDPNEPFRNIFIWSVSHLIASEFYITHLKNELGFKWADPIDVSLHNIPAWRQFVALGKYSPWCLSFTPKEVFIKDYNNYEYGVSPNMMATHEQQIKHWIESNEVLTIQIGNEPELDQLQSKHILKYEQ